MSDNSETPTPTTSQLTETLRSVEPNAARDLGIELLESGKVTPNSSIAAVIKAIREHYAPRQ